MAELSGRAVTSPLSLVAMSKHHGVSVPFLKKIAHCLKFHGLIESKEGIGGGYALARPAETITVWDILSSFATVSDELNPGVLTCPINTSCLPQQIRHTVHKRIKKCLETISLQEVFP